MQKFVLSTFQYIHVFGIQTRTSSLSTNKLGIVHRNIDEYNSA